MIEIIAPVLLVCSLGILICLLYDHLEQIKLTESLKEDLKGFVNKDGENND